MPDTTSIDKSFGLPEKNHDKSLPAFYELDPDDDLEYDDVELPSDPWTVCTAKCYTQRTFNAMGLYGIALSALFLMQFRWAKRRESRGGQRFFFLWPIAAASASDFLLSTRCIEDCKHLKRRHMKTTDDINNQHV